MRVRGLKHKSTFRVEYRDGVAPRAGAWIETFIEIGYVLYPQVAPRAGAWIETFDALCLSF